MLFLCVLYFSFTYSSIFRERESSETILLFSDSGGSEVEPREDGARPVTGSPFIGPPEPFFLHFILLQLKREGVAKAKGEGEKEKECTTECKS